MAWMGETSRHSAAAYKAWKTKRRNAKAAAARKAEGIQKRRATMATRMAQRLIDTGEATIE